MVRTVIDEIDGGYHSERHGYTGIFCNKCFRHYILKTDLRVDIEQIDPTGEERWPFGHCGISLRCSCGNDIDFEQWGLDPNITEAIAILNRKGYYTTSSCEGHLIDLRYRHLWGIYSTSHPSMTQDSATIGEKKQDPRKNYSFAYVSILDKHQADILNDYPLPKPWLRDPEYIACFRIHTDDDPSAPVQTRMDSLLEWARALPIWKEYCKKEIKEL